VGQLGVNAHGEVLEAGQVPDCYLGLLLHDDNYAGAAGVLIVSPAAVLHPSVPQPDGALLYELVTGHPDRAPRELVFLADLTVELRAWPTDTWPRSGSTRRRPPLRWWPAGGEGTFRACGWAG
jgi:hypothetical protein